MSGPLTTTIGTSLRDFPISTPGGYIQGGQSFAGGTGPSPSQPPSPPRTLGGSMSGGDSSSSGGGVSAATDAIKTISTQNTSTPNQINVQVNPSLLQQYQQQTAQQQGHFNSGTNFRPDNQEKINYQQRLSEFYNRGYNQYESDIFAKSNISTTASAQQADNVIVSYQLANIPQTLFQYAFKGAGDTQAQQIAEAQKQEQFKATTPLQYFQKGDYPSALRRTYLSFGEKFVGGVEEPIRLKIGLGQPDTKEQIQQAGQIIGDTALFATFAPLMKTTTQITRELAPIRNDIAATGYSQTKEGNAIITDLNIRTSTGQTATVRGLTISEVRSIPITQDILNIAEKDVAKITKSAELTASKTLAVGEITQGRGIVFPTGKIIEPNMQKFAGVDFGLTRDINNKFVEVSKGATSDIDIGATIKGVRIKVQKPSYYQSLGVGGKLKEDLTGVVGGTIGEKSIGRFGAIVKDVENVPIEFRDISSPLSKGSQKLISEQAYKSTLRSASSMMNNVIKEPITRVSAVSSSSVISSIIKTNSNIIKLSAKEITPSAYAGTGLYERTSPQQSFMFKQLSLSNSVINRASQSPILSISQSDKSMLKEQQRFIQPELSTSAQRYVELESQSERQLLSQAQRYVQSQREEQNRFQTIFNFEPIRKGKKIVESPIWKGDEGKHMKVSKKMAFDLGLIKKGKPYIARKGISRELARDLGAGAVLGDLRATFFIRPSKEPLRDTSAPTGFFKEVEQMFRQPKGKSRYKKLGVDVFIQKEIISSGGRGRGRLTTRGERSEIQSIKRQKMEKYLR